MRICMMNDNFYRSSGVAVAMRRISEAMPEITWFFAGCSGERVQEDLSWIDPGRYASFDLKTARPLHLAAEIVRFRRWFRSNGLGLVHSHHRRLAAILQFAGLPVLYTGQLYFPYERWFAWFHPRSMTAITRSVAQNLLETTGQDVLAVVSNPTPFPEEAPQVDVPRVAKRAICIGRLAPVKGHANLLGAWKILCERGYAYHLDLVGEGELRASLQAQAERDGIAHLIHFLGFRSSVSEAVGDALFAVLASQVEGQGIVTLEAAAMGRPSLVTAVPGSVDLIPPGAVLPNGVPFGDPLALANALEQWFASPELVVQEGRRFFEFL